MTDKKLARHKFFDRTERQTIIHHCEVNAEQSKKKGGKIWIVRWMLVDLAFYSGLRVSEIAHLKIKDLNLTNDDPYIRVRDGKGGKDRDVYIRNQLVAHLSDFIQSKPKRNEPTGGGAPLFSGRDGHYTPTALTISFKTAVKDTDGLRNDLSIHSARHTFATFLYSDTKHLRFVQRQLGHANLKTTSQYVGILPEDNGRLANMMS